MDSIDHFITTINGKGTFHSLTNSDAARRRQLVIKQLRNGQLTTSFVKAYRIPIHSDLSSSKKDVEMKPVIELESPYVLPTEQNYNFLWHTNQFVKASSETSMNWFFFMQDITSGSEANSNAVIGFFL